MSTRYRLQEAFKPLGPESTLQLANSHVLVVGCGATGSHVVDTLARMGVGYLTVADPDIIEGENLHRQLYTENDIVGDKAAVLTDHVAAINSEVSVRTIITRITADNIVGILERENLPVNLILDCTDNMESRWLINKYAVKHGIPWIYGGVGKSEGMVMAIVPGQSACLRCTGWAPQDTKEKLSGGIFPPAVGMLASMQATLAVKILTGNIDGYTLQLRRFNVWTMETMSFNVNRNENCEVCGEEKASHSLPVYYECGICDHFHPWSWNGDCRDDANRLTYDDLDKRHRENGYELRPMEERVAAKTS